MNGPQEMLPRYDQASLTQVASDCGLRLVVLFGSWARRSPPPGPESDVDIAVLGCPREKYFDCYEVLSAAFGEHMLDLVRLEEADPLFRHEIMQCGVLLWGDPNLFCEYRAYAYRDFTDSADLFALEQILHKKKMERLRQQLHDSP